MPSRLLEIYIPEDSREEAAELLSETGCSEVWEEDLSGGMYHLQTLVSSEESTDILDNLEKRFSGLEEFRVVILPVEGSIPRTEEEAEEPPPKSEENKPIIRPRISREELYSDIEETCSPGWSYYALIFLSTLVATVGLLKGNVAIIIGAMVIAPLLGPNVGLALATTLYDTKLAKKAAVTGLAGVAIALAVSLISGALIPVDANLPEIASRTTVTFGDIVVALAAGGAGALAFSSGMPTMLVGVMVAVALLPPLVAAGLLLGSGQFGPASSALLLLVSNLICVNLAGVLTFLVQGVRPLTWWETDRAKKATRKAVAVWFILLAALIAFLYLARG